MLTQTSIAHSFGTNVVLVPPIFYVLIFFESGPTRNVHDFKQKKKKSSLVLPGFNPFTPCALEVRLLAQIQIFKDQMFSLL